MSKPIRVVLLGAGDRGMNNFGEFALRFPQLMKIVAVAEPNEEKRALFAQKHNLTADQLYTSWEEVLAKPRSAEALINAMPDHLHYAANNLALDFDYHLLVEKPIASTPEQVLTIYQKAKNRHQIFQTCFELRYTPFFATIKDIIDSGEIGDVVVIEHKESLIYWHMAHSFVRGNWGNSTTSNPMLLAKTCHDFDLLTWLVPSECLYVSSFGGLNYFHAKNAPANAPNHCIDGCPHEDNCPYSAKKIYLRQNTDWPVSVISVDHSLDSRIQALKQGPYGRCVFKCDNDVVDNQVVNLEFKNGARVSFVMTGHSHENTRTIRISGTKGTLRGHFIKSEIELFGYNSNSQKIIKPSVNTDEYGHGGGDERLVKHFLSAINQNEVDKVNRYLDGAIESHLIIFAAEESRINHKLLDLDEYKRRFQK